MRPRASDYRSTREAAPAESPANAPPTASPPCGSPVVSPPQNHAPSSSANHGTHSDVRSDPLARPLPRNHRQMHRRRHLRRVDHPLCRHHKITLRRLPQITEHIRMSDRIHSRGRSRGITGKCTADGISAVWITRCVATTKSRSVVFRKSRNTFGCRSYFGKLLEEMITPIRCPRSNTRLVAHKLISYRSTTFGASAT